MKKKKHFILLLNKMCMNLKNAHLSLCLLRGLCDSHHPAVTHTGWGAAPTSAARVLVDLSLTWDKRSLFKEQMLCSDSLECRNRLRDQSIPFYQKANQWTNSVCCHVVSAVSDTRSAKAGVATTKLVSCLSQLVDTEMCVLHSSP